MRFEQRWWLKPNKCDFIGELERMVLTGLTVTRRYQIRASALLFLPPINAISSASRVAICFACSPNGQPVQ